MSVELDHLIPDNISGLPLSQELVAAVARRLDSDGVPNVLWGNYLLTVFGVPSIVAVRYSSRHISLNLLTVPRMPNLSCQIPTSPLHRPPSPMQVSSSAWSKAVLSSRKP